LQESNTYISPQEILQTYWGYKDFRPQQLSVIEAVLAGKDVLTLLPTGAGKSICYQIPVLCKEGIGIVISPLIALMQDQVKDLKSKNITAINLGGEIDFYTQQKIYKDIQAGKFQFIYCSPEKLAQKNFQEFLQTIPIQLIAIDEAHCISQWGYDFRPSYRKLDIIKKIFPSTPVLAMTASAIPMVQEDMVKQLQLKSPIVITDSFLRPNLSYSVKKVAVKLHSLRSILSQKEGSTIIYCGTRNNVTQLTQLLKAYKFSVEEYHAGLPIQVRKAVQESWMNNQTQIVICTSAFGMGINKPDVRTVIHYDIPGSIEQYYQEAGRAGRDGESAEAILLYQQSDWDYWEALQLKKFPPIDTIKKVYQHLADFVQLPIGMGEQDQFPFDFEQFCLIFDLDKIIARNALQWIAQEGHVKFSEASFKPSMVQIVADRNTIESFERDNVINGIVLQTLLRTYGGILDSPQMIQESLLAEVLQRDIYFVQKQLVSLAEFGLIYYHQKESQPIVQFNWNRTSANFMKLDLDVYTARKKAFMERVKAFAKYIQQPSIGCRSKFLASYFGEKDPSSCNICDICTSTKD
jgi:ATP-dependent DNA helicase RecQ